MRKSVDELEFENGTCYTETRWAHAADAAEATNPDAPAKATISMSD